MSWHGNTEYQLLSFTKGPIMLRFDVLLVVSMKKQLHKTVELLVIFHTQSCHSIGMWEVDSYCTSINLTHCGLMMPYGNNRSGSTLAQVMACCLIAPNHYVNQCWLIIKGIQWHPMSFTSSGFTQTWNQSITISHPHWHLQDLWWWLR